MTEKDVRMSLSDDGNHVQGEFRLQLVLGSPPYVRITIQMSGRGSFQGEISLSQFVEMLHLQGEIGRSIRARLAEDDATYRQATEAENNRKLALQVGQAVTAIDRMAIATGALAIALTPAPKPTRKVRRKAVRP